MKAEGREPKKIRQRARCNYPHNNFSLSALCFMPYASIFFFLSACCLLPLFSCAHLPQLEQMSIQTDLNLEKKCNVPFLSGSWRLIHSIEAGFPGGKQSLLIGVSIISSEKKSIHCVMMTIEGLVLFDAEYNKSLTIHRAVKPFDKKEFAEGMIKDIQMMFFKPDGEIIQLGLAKTGAFVCRFQDKEDRTSDVGIYSDGTWEILKYSPYQRLQRSVSAKHIENNIPNLLEFKAYGTMGYSLKLKLTEAQLIGD